MLLNEKKVPYMTRETSGNMTMDTDIMVLNSERRILEATDRKVDGYGESTVPDLRYGHRNLELILPPDIQIY